MNIECLYCNNQLEVDDEYINSELKCPICFKRFRSAWWRLAFTSWACKGSGHFGNYKKRSRRTHVPRNKI